MSLDSPERTPSLSNGSRKRKHAALDEAVGEPQDRVIREDIARAEVTSPLERFALRPLPASVYTKPFTFQPLRVVPRRQLPLAFLQAPSSSYAVPSDRLLSGAAPKPQTGAAIGEVHVLVARLESDNALYVVEEVKDGVYALCKLAAWVKPADFNDLTPLALQDLILRKMGVAGKHPAHSRRSSAIILTSAGAEGTERSAKRVKVSMAPPPAAESRANETASASTEPKLIAKTPKNSAKPTQASAPDGEVKVQTSSEVVFATLVKQYLEALYWSKNSLAFFTKGPLSRARASFFTQADEKRLSSNLTTFLRSMLLEVKSMDKKYRDKLPEMIKAFPLTTVSDDEEGPPSGSKRKRPRKIQLSKDGLYPFEEDYVKKWWTSDDWSPGRVAAADSAQAMLRQKLGDLRSRETFAQIVLILEIMALEATRPEASPAQFQQLAPDEQREKKKKQSKKDPADLKLLLDLLLDKLSIWQSVEQEVPGCNKEQSDDMPSEKPVDQDILGTFCTEVIVPFYKARLPKQAAEVIRKLSGQADSSDRKPRAKPKPGEPVLREKAPSKELRRLKKTNSDSQAIFSPPSLIRSATGSFIKRENSEVPLSAIPLLKDSRPASRSRQPSVQLQHLNRRQVNLGALSAVSEARLKRKATIEDELKAAISTLKRPNRGQAVKDFVDASDQRVFASTSKRKQHPARRILQNVQNIQVMGTPRNRRKSEAFAPVKSNQKATKLEQMPPPASAVVPASSITAPIQSSASHSSLSRDHIFNRPSAVVAETPSRGVARSANLFSSAALGMSDEQDAISAFKIPSTAVKAMDRVTGIEETPSKNRTKPLSSANIFAPQLQTPPRRRRPPLDDAIASTPLRPTTSIGRVGRPIQSENLELALEPTEHEQESIYDALGWNDLDELA